MDGNCDDLHVNMGESQFSNPSFDGADLDKNARNGCYLFNCNLRINLNERMVEKWSGLGGLAHLGDPCIEQSPSRQCL